MATIEALVPGQAVHLFGNSMGGPVAVQVAAQRRAEAEGEARRRRTAWLREAFVGWTQSLLAIYRDRGLDRPWALAGPVEAPTLLVCRRADKLVDPKAAHRATKEFREAHVMVNPDSGHVARMEHPDLVDRWWREFLG